MNDNDFYEMCIGLRQQLRSLLSQVDFMIERQKEAAIEPETNSQPERPRTFGKPKEILNAEQ